MASLKGRPCFLATALLTLVLMFGCGCARADDSVEAEGPDPSEAFAEQMELSEKYSPDISPYSALRSHALEALMFDFDGDGIEEGEKLADRVLYVAYGSNLNIAQMEERCPGAEPVCSGKLEGVQLSFRRSKTDCYLSIDPAEGSSVDVVVWSISSDDEKTLDRREGYPKYYQKTVLPVRVQTNEGEKVLYGTVYYLPLDRQMGPCSREYLERVLAGYDHFGFDPAPLYAAYNRASKAVAQG